jgi:hypothetical protein
MDKIMPKTMGILRPDRVLVIGTVDDYMKVELKVWGTQLAGWGLTQYRGWYMRKTGGRPLEEPGW